VDYSLLGVTLNLSMCDRGGALYFVHVTVYSININLPALKMLSTNTTELILLILQPYARVDYIPYSGTKNLATGHNVYVQSQPFLTNKTKSFVPTTAYEYSKHKRDSWEQNNENFLTKFLKQGNFLFAGNFNILCYLAC